MNCVNTVGSSAQPVHRLQGIRYPGRDYRIPAFYLITMTTLGRKPLFGVCEDDRTILNPEGRLVHELWRRMATDYPQIKLHDLVIMPDHLHGIVRVTKTMPKPLGVPLRAFKSQVTSAMRQRFGKPALKIWTPGYHDWAVWRRGSLAAYTRYVRDNPRRFCLKRKHPDLFVRINRLHHARLPSEETWSGYGNIFLLDKPEHHALRVSRNITTHQLDALRAEILERVQSGCVLVSPFISPGEKNISRVALDTGGSVILMKPDGFERTFRPPGHYFDLCAQGRLLILACRPPANTATPITRAICLAMNRWCETIASQWAS